MLATRTNRILLTAAAVVGITAGAAGIAGAVTSSGGTEPSLPRADAEAAALAEVPGTVTEVEHEGDDGADVWSVEVIDAEGRQHDVVVDAAGQVVASDLDDDRDDRSDGHADDTDEHEGDPGLAADAAVTQEQAERTAVAEATGTVARSHIEQEDGLVVWDVEVDGDDGLRHDLQIDATTGAIVEHDIDD